MMANLGSAIEERWEIIVKQADLPGFMKLLFDIASHESLAVSIPVMTTFVRIMRKDTLSESEAVLPLIPGLLDLCTARLIHVRHSFTSLLQCLEIANLNGARSMNPFPKERTRRCYS